MQITIELPNDLASHDHPAREALEAFAVEAYRNELLPRHEAAQMLGLGRIAFDDLLIRRGVTHDFYGTDDLLRDAGTIGEFRAQGHTSA